MKRTIKFRVWDKQENSFYSEEYLKHFNVAVSWDGKTIYQNFVSGEREVGNEVIIQQFTGVVTETEKEIYEGDIVSYKSKTQDRIGVVQFCVYYNGWAVKDSKAYPESDFGVERMDSPFMCFSDLKVIGNIFENPELLK